MKRILTSIILALSAATAFAADTAQAILNPRFKTLRVEKEGEFLSPPVIQLGKGDRIVVSFDEIGEDYSRLQFRLIHCNADWQPSRLVESEYLDSFNYDDIEDYAFSTNTFVNYVNYRFTIPSEKVLPIASGNYVAEVYPQDDPDNVILRARFQISEDSAVVGGFATPRTDRGYNTEWQQLNLALDVDNKDLNPYSDILISVTQNRRPDTERFAAHPMRVEGGRIIYEHLQELIFPASNEFRRFETVRVDYPGMGVDHVEFGGSNYHAWLKPDSERASHEYAYDQTQRGRFMIDDYNSTDPDLAADYVTVNFTLDFPELMNGDVYVDGDFTNHNYSDAYRMTYDREKGQYTLALPLKQGSYNYQYVAVKEGGNAGSTSLIEGDKYETLNEYTVSVYYRPAINRADRLIGSATIYVN